MARAPERADLWLDMPHGASHRSGTLGVRVRHRPRSLTVTRSRLALPLESPTTGLPGTTPKTDQAAVRLEPQNTSMRANLELARRERDGG